MKAAIKELKKLNLFHVLTFLLFLVGVRLTFQLVKESSLYTATSAARVPVWLKSSECSARTGKFLVTCTNDKDLIPVESVSIADDRGHNLLLNFYSVISGYAASALTLVRLNMIINFLGITILGLLLFQSGFQLLSIAWLLTWTCLGFMWKIYGPDVYAISMGLSSFSMILTILTLRCVNARNMKSFFLTALTCFMISTFCCLMREAVGMIGIVASIMTAAFAILLNFSWRKIFLLSLMSIILFFTFRFPTKVLTKARNIAYNLDSSAYVSSHGLSHTLYLGLGTVPNPWGIIWDDGFADKSVKKVNPKAIYCSPEYFKILNALYFKIIFDSPVDVLKIYFKKMWLSFKMILTESIVRGLALLAFIAVVLYVLLAFLVREVVPPFLTPKNFILSFSFGILSLGLLAQGMLGYPDYSYLQPAVYSFLVLLMFIIIEILKQVFYLSFAYYKKLSFGIRGQG